MNKSIQKLPMPMRLDKRFAIKPQSKRDKVVSLFKSGWSLTKLANKHNVTIGTIHAIVDRSYRKMLNEASSIRSSIRMQDNTELAAEYQREYEESRKEREPRIRRHYAMGLAQNA